VVSVFFNVIAINSLTKIGGVAEAIGIGGPGVAFWLIVASFLAMSTKLVECTLGVKYRKVNTDGAVSGGPMYYLT
jgi:AGCS family alanine or glycine:cation symporter